MAAAVPGPLSTARVATPLGSCGGEREPTPALVVGSGAAAWLESRRKTDDGPACGAPARRAGAHDAGSTIPSRDTMVAPPPARSWAAASGPLAQRHGPLRWSSYMPRCQGRAVHQLAPFSRRGIDDLEAFWS